MTNRATVFWTAALLLASASTSLRAADTTKGTEQKKKTLAVLPFLASTPAEKKLADRMRFAVSQKISNDAKGGATANIDRMDNVQVEQVISALQMVWDGGGGRLPLR